VIQLTNVTKRYGGTAAINGISLSIHSDAGIYCLLGRNGAGKTTLMKMLAGHIAASDGSIAVNGYSVSPGRMPDSVCFIESGAAQFNMKVPLLLDTASQLNGEFDRDFAYEMARKFRLDLNKRFKQLSFGMKTMLSAIIMLANNADIILLDEPTLGFDAIMREQFNDLLMESYQAHPRMLIVSTHQIDEIAKVAERLIIIDNGNLLLEAGIDDIDERAYTLSGPVQAVTPLLDGLNVIGQTKMGGVMAAHIYGERITPPQGVTLDRMSLQDFFISMVGGSDNE
jgi:ABC-2 type transport system ATP-binding protein